MNWTEAEKIVSVAWAGRDALSASGDGPLPEAVEAVMAALDRGQAVIVDSGPGQI